MSFLTLPFTLSLNSLKLAGFYIYPDTLVLCSARKQSQIHAVFSVYTSMCTFKNTKLTEKSHPCFSFFVFHFSSFSFLASVFSTSFGVCETLTYALPDIIMPSLIHLIFLLVSSPSLREKVPFSNMFLDLKKSSLNPYSAYFIILPLAS